MAADRLTRDDWIVINAALSLYQAEQEDADPQATYNRFGEAGNEEDEERYALDVKHYNERMERLWKVRQKVYQRVPAAALGDDHAE